MLKTKTVIVLGAGASKPFGFPTGAELTNQVWRRLRPGNDPYNQLVTAGGYSDEEITSFRDALWYSGKNSVDAFLEHRTEYMTIGKNAISAILIPLEERDNVFAPEGNWLRYLYNNMNTRFEEFGQNNLSFITFNYDRCPEYFLHTALSNTYDRKEQDIVKALDQIPIIHLHGRLGFLPWQGKDTRDFAPRIDDTTLSISSRNIKIVHEDIAGRDQDFEQAKTLLADAQQIFFLGFGFGSTNVERLGIRLLEPGRAIATYVGLNNSERQAILRDCDNRIAFGDGDALLFFVSMRAGTKYSRPALSR